MSLPGGVFIATLFGLALAMMTLGIEILYYKRKDRKNNKIAKPKNPKHLKHVQPVPKTITIGSVFAPGDPYKIRMSHMSLYPRARAGLPRIN